MKSWLKENWFKVGWSILAAVIIPLSVSLAHATSGACSDNGGVYCAAGPSVNGYAVCSDGTVSSVPYSSMAECQGVITCTQAQMNGLEEQYNAAGDLNQITTLQAQITQIQSNEQEGLTAEASKPGVVASIVNGEMQSTAAEFQGKIANLQNQIEALQTDLYVKLSSKY